MPFKRTGYCLKCNARLNKRQDCFCSKACQYAYLKSIAGTPEFPTYKHGTGHQDLQYVKAYAKRNPEKLHAQKLLQWAVTSGKIKRLPCEVCGVAKSEAHHDNYSKPYEVRWLCRKHHREHHATRKAA